MQMSKNRPQVKARDGKSIQLEFLPAKQTQNGHFCFLRAALGFLRGRGRVLFRRVVGLTGLEPVTLRLSSACSNQLSYRPWVVPRGLWRQGDSNP